MHDLILILKERFKTESLILPKKEWPADVQDVLNYLNSSLFDPDLQINLVLPSCGIRAKSFPGKFRYYVGLTPVSYIKINRIICARFIIDQLEMPIPVSYLGYDLGYQSHSAFTNAFRSVVGVAPNHYLKQIEGK